MPIKSASRPKKPDLTISIVSYNTKALLGRCLESIYKHTKHISFEVIVVDNASTDDSAAMVRKKFPQVKLIKNKTNLFYTGANNQALNLAKGRYFLILNSDIFLKNNAFKPLINYMNKNPRIGACEPLQKYEDGRIAPTGSRHNTPLLDFMELTWLGRQFKQQPAINKFRMKTKNRTKTWPADVICDAVMLTRTRLLKQIKGYDEKLKLYYTENDLCQRIQAEKYRAVHQGTITVWHTVSASTDKAGWHTISNIYAKDALIYYLKHGPKLSGCLLFLAMKLNNSLIRIKNNPGLLFILVLAGFLRSFRLEELMVFIGDQGRDYLAARDWLLGSPIPLVGIASSVPWLKQGPVFIWLIALALKLGRFNPAAPAMLTAALGVLAVYFTYQLAKNWFSEKISLLSALIMATSSLVVAHSRMAYHTSPIPLFTVLFLLSLGQSLFWPCLLFSLLFQFELTTAPLILLIPFTYWLKKQKLNFKTIAFGLLGLLIPMLPKLIYDITHGWQQTFGFVAWLGYRLISFFGYSGRHTVSLTSLKTVSLAILINWHKYVSWSSLELTLLMGLIVLVFTLIKLKQLPRLILAFLVINLTAFYFHQGPSEAYFPVLFPIWAILIAWAASNLKPKLIGLALIGLTVSINLYYQVTQDFGSRNYGPTLTDRFQLTRLIINRAPDQQLRLINPPQGPQFESHLDNYRYLLWWQGARLSDKPDQTYSIYQGSDSNFIQPLNTTVFHFPNQKLIRYD